MVEYESLSENPTSILERGIKPYREFIEIGKDVSVKLILKDKVGNEISSKKEGLTKKEGGSFKSCSAWKGSNDLP